jgi:hypothetical protein
MRAAGQLHDQRPVKSTYLQSPEIAKPATNKDVVYGSAENINARLGGRTSSWNSALWMPAKISVMPKKNRTTAVHMKACIIIPYRRSQAPMPSVVRLFLSRKSQQLMSALGILIVNFVIFFPFHAVMMKWSCFSIAETQNWLPQ